MMTTRRSRLLTVAAAFWLGGCMNHYVIHPKKPPSQIVTWSDEIVRGKLLMRLEWARPAGEGPFPAVLVHPEAGHPARQMRGILHSLAGEGYLAMAADYRREHRGTYRASLFTWKDEADVTAAFEVLSRHPDADPDRIATMGYSQGGVYSLLIAARVPDRVKAVVAYYPVTDFAHWLYETDRRGPRRWVFGIIGRYFRRKSGAEDDDAYHAFLDRMSPLPQAESIVAPVLLIHGDNDTSAGLEESQRLAERLRELGREVDLVSFAGAGHVFNFRNAEKASAAWEAVLDWLSKM